MSSIGIHRHAGICTNPHLKKKKSFVVDHLKVFIEFEPLSFKWLSCAVLCLVVFDSDPMDCSPLGSSIHADSPDKNNVVCFLASLQGIITT